MEYSRTNQGGSVLAFVIVGVVFAAMVVGGVYLLRQRGEQARTAPVIAQNNTDKQQPQPSGQPAEEKDKKPETNTPPAQTKPEAEKKPASESDTKPQIPATGQVTPPATEQPTGTRPNVASGAPIDHSGALPQTGPLDTALQLLAMGTLTALVIAYIRSRLQTVPSL